MIRVEEQESGEKHFWEYNRPTGLGLQHHLHCAMLCQALQCHTFLEHTAANHLAGAAVINSVEKTTAGSQLKQYRVNAFKI